GRRTHARTARPRADVKGETPPMGMTPTSIAQLSSLCSLCLCALCVQRTSRGGVLHGIEVRCWELAFDTENTEAQRTQRNFRYFSSCLSKPFDTSGRTGVRSAAECQSLQRLAGRRVDDDEVDAARMRRIRRRAERERQDAGS